LLKSIILRPLKSHTNSLQKFLRSDNDATNQSIFEQSTYKLVISTAVFLHRNNNTVMANNLAMRSSN